MLRATCLTFLLASCVTSRGRVNVPVSTGIWGGALIVGGASVAAGTCKPSPEQCDEIERGSPVAAGGMVILGASLLALAYMLDRAGNRVD